MKRRSFLRLALLAVTSAPILRAEKIADFFAPLKEIDNSYVWSESRMNWALGTSVTEIARREISEALRVQEIIAKYYGDSRC